MSAPIHILVFCPKPKGLPAATLVFRTLRIGFPRGLVHLHMRSDISCRQEILDAAAPAGVGKVHLIPDERVRHDEWLEKLIHRETEPFWICDTDVVFWNRFRHQPDGSALAGVRVPSFCEPWTGTRYRERLHPCLMRIDPHAFRVAHKRFLDRFPPEPFQPYMEPICQQWQPERVNGRVIHHFYDTLAMAWHAFGGQEFTQEQIESFDHLNCATYADLIAPSLDFDILGAHKAIYQDHHLARGSWARQFAWFAAHQGS
jgi:hypothetical protein